MVMAKTWKDFQTERVRQVTEEGREVPHGVLGYVHYGCRCDVCRTENAARHRAAREDRKARAHEAPNHGTYSTYVNWGCQCSACHEVGTRTLREQAAKRRATQLAQKRGKRGRVRNADK